jgi:hypothetical protein
MTFLVAILKTSLFVVLPLGFVALLLVVFFELSIFVSAAVTILMYLSIALPIGLVAVGVSAALDQDEREEEEALFDQIWHKNSL